MEPGKICRLGLCLVHLCTELLRKPVAGEVEFPKVVHMGCQPLPSGWPRPSCLGIRCLNKAFVCLRDDLGSCAKHTVSMKSPHATQLTTG